MAGARLTYSVVGFLFFASTDTIFRVWDKITLWCNQKHCNIGRDKLQGELAVPGAFCILKELLHYLMPKWANLCCSSGAEISYSSYKCRKCQKPVTFLTVPWFYKVCQGLVRMMGSLMVPAFTAGPEQQLVLRRTCNHCSSVMIHPALQRCCQKSSLYSTFCELTETTSIHHWCWIHRLHPNYRWASSSLHSAAPFSMCLQRLGFAVQRKEMQFFLRVPLLA